MKLRMLIFGLIILGLSSCKQEDYNSKALEKRIDNLEKNLEATYKPGLGEFMSGIQVHHAKLWFAGVNNNWELADFEVGETKEALEDIKVYCTDRPEIKEIGIIEPTLENVSQAVKQKNGKQFENSFMELTNTCNSCHVATNHGFNVIKVPDSPPFSNQDFEVK